jgi:hypothetical protein
MRDVHRKWTIIAQRNRILIHRPGDPSDTVIALPRLHRLTKAFADGGRIRLANVFVCTKIPAASSAPGKSEPTYSVNA